jgi:Lysine efflux permease
MAVIDFIQGFIIGSTLIIAIGPQNLFVIQQGLKKQYVFTIVLFCSLSDSILIIIGINLSNLIINISPNTISIIKIIGGIWLTYYGSNKILKIKNSKKINNYSNVSDNFRKILSTLILITYINPHVYLDTIILIGSISANFQNKLYFGMGASIGSFIFLFYFRLSN